MSRATGLPNERSRLTVASALGSAAGRAAVLYVVYLCALSAAIALKHPGWALGATSVVTGLAIVQIPRWRPLGVALVLVAVLPVLGVVSDGALPLMFLPPIALNLGLALTFGRSLRRGDEPLISTFARAERGVLEPDLLKYTRSLTLTWTCFFVGAATLSGVLAAATPIAVWGWFVALGNTLAVAAFFVGEFAYRKWRFPQYQHASPLSLARIVAGRWRTSAEKR
jgi:uncharacterized membrane protein